MKARGLPQAAQVCPADRAILGIGQDFNQWYAQLRSNSPCNKNTCTLSCRTRNIGAQVCGPVATKWNSIGCHPNNKTAIFPSVAYGFAAHIELLRNYCGKQGRCTITSVVNKWAATTDERHAAYANFVSRNAGIPTNQVFNPNDVELVGRLALAMACFEAGAMPYSVDELKQGLAMASGGAKVPVPSNLGQLLEESQKGSFAPNPVYTPSELRQFQTDYDQYLLQREVALRRLESTMPQPYSPYGNGLQLQYCPDGSVPYYGQCQQQQCPAGMQRQYANGPCVQIPNYQQQQQYQQLPQSQQPFPAQTGGTAGTPVTPSTATQPQTSQSFSSIGEYLTPKTGDIGNTASGFDSKAFDLLSFRDNAALAPAASGTDTVGFGAGSMSSGGLAPGQEQQGQAGLPPGSGQSTFTSPDLKDLPPVSPAVGERPPGLVNTILTNLRNALLKAYDFLVSLRVRLTQQR
jgi:hypothetical protein